MKIGYARVSTKEQNLARQIKMLTDYGCEEIFEEKVSGKNIEDREQLKKLLNYMRSDDELVVISLDRLSRDSDDIDKILRGILDRGAIFTALDLPSFKGIENKSMRKMMSNMVLELFKYMSQNEREKIRERQAQGVALAKNREIYKGSKPRYRADTHNEKDKYIFETVVTMLKNNESNLSISRKTGISKNTVKVIKEREGL